MGHSSAQVTPPGSVSLGGKYHRAGGFQEHAGVNEGLGHAKA